MLCLRRNGNSPSETATPPSQPRTEMINTDPEFGPFSPPPSRVLENLLDALRLELTQYAGLLVLLREQERHISKMQPADLMTNTGQVGVQLNKVARARGKRERWMNEYITELDHAVTTRQLSGCSLGAHRQLLTSLIEQINLLLQEIQQHLRHNHSLLKDALAPPKHVLDRIVWN